MNICMNHFCLVYNNCQFKKKVQMEDIVSIHIEHAGLNIVSFLIMTLFAICFDSLSSLRL